MHRGDQLGRGGDQVNACGGLDAAQDQKVHHPQQDRRAHDRLPGIPVAENNGVRSIGKEAERGKTITRYETLAITAHSQ